MPRISVKIISKDLHGQLGIIVDILRSSQFPTLYAIQLGKGYCLFERHEFELV